MDNNASLHTHRAELERVERSIAKLIDAIKSGIDPELLKSEADALSKRKQTLAAMLSDKAEAPVFIHPNMAYRFSVAVQDLISAFKVPEHHDRAAELLRGMIERIVLTPIDGDLAIDLMGDLAGILKMSVAPPAGKRRNPLDLSWAAETELKHIRLLSERIEAPNAIEQLGDSQVVMAGFRPSQSVLLEPIEVEPHARSGRPPALASK